MVSGSTLAEGGGWRSRDAVNRGCHLRPAEGGGEEPVGALGRPREAVSEGLKCQRAKWD